MAKRVLAGDDSASIRRVVSFTLTAAGYEVIEAVDEKDALAKLNGSPVELLIADLNMPNLDGLGLIRQVRGDPVHRFVPILMLTTESQASRKRQGKEAGATGWVVKPFKPDQLVSAVRKVIG